MIAEVVAIGTELLMGETVDTNSAWLSDRLANLGMEVHWSQRVDDDQHRIVHCLREALERSEVVITTGGLGPTEDDLTREAMAEVVGEELRVDAALEEHLRAVFATFNRPMPACNVKQAWVIPSAEALSNPVGTAPGWFVRHRGRVLVALPGPPSEMHKMWEEQVVPRLALPASALSRTIVKIQGLGESAVAEMLGDLVRGTNPTVATYAHDDGIHVRVAARAATESDAEAMAAPVVAQMRETFGERIWGEDDDSLPILIGRRLEALGCTFCTVESLTGGRVASEMTAVPGISAVYRGGAVTYHAEAKMALGVPREIIEAHGVVSDETALAMAQAATRFFGADYAVATTGVAGPSSLEGKPAGRVHVAVCGPHATRVRTFEFPRRARAGVQDRATYSALFMLLDLIGR